MRQLHQQLIASHGLPRSVPPPPLAATRFGAVTAAERKKTRGPGATIRVHMPRGGGPPAVVLRFPSPRCSCVSSPFLSSFLSAFPFLQQKTAAKGKEGKRMQVDALERVHRTAESGV
jgi:hypothetical protein